MLTTGVIESTVKFDVAEPTRPARSVCVTVTEWAPWVSVPVMKPLEQVTAAPPSTEQVVVPGLVSVTVKFTAGVVEAAQPELAGALIVTTGLVRSTMTVLLDEETLVLLAASVAVAVIVCEPAVRADVATLQAPVPLAVVVATSVAPS